MLNVFCAQGVPQPAPALVWPLGLRVVLNASIARRERPRPGCLWRGLAPAGGAALLSACWELGGSRRTEAEGTRTARCILPTLGRVLKGTKWELAF